MRSLCVFFVLFGLGPASFRGGVVSAAENLPEIRADGDLITVDGEPIFLKGVAYSPFIAGDAPWTPGAPRNVNFQDDLNEIRNVLNANAVRVYDPLPRAFYDAARNAGVWVIQGFFVPNPDANVDLLNADFLAALQTDLRNAIDELNRIGAADVILAYVIGSGISTTSIADTIRDHQNEPRFQGTFYSTPAETELPRVDSYRGCAEPVIGEFPDPHPFQSFMARLADTVTSHEMDRYQCRHLIGHATWPNTNPFLGARDRPAPGLDVPVDLGFLDVIFENVHTFGFPYVAYYGLPDYLRRLKIHYASKPVVILESG